MKFFQISNLILLTTLLAVFFITPILVNAQITEPVIPGLIRGEGTHFEITNSVYLNIVLDSSESIKLRMDSIPEMVTMMIEKSTSTPAIQTQITLSGFSPSTTYYLYEDNYHNLTEFTSNEDGSYAYIQDLSRPRFVFIQPRKSTKFIKDNSTGGDCASIGIWNWPTKTCILTTDLTETIQIDNNGITLDGNNHILIGTNTGMGVWFDRKANILIKNLTITSFSSGAGVWFSSKSTFIDNVISNNAGNGIILLFSSENNLIQNKISNNKFDGISILYSNNNEIIDNIIEENEFYGIDIEYSNNNTVENNTVTATRSQTGGTGLYIREATNNAIANNTISHNKNSGVYILWADNNVLTGNTISHNLWYGFYIIFSKYNKVYRNNIIDNFLPIVFWPLSPSENKFYLPLPIGGNYWSTFDSPTEGCSDGNDDRICDSPYYFGYGDQDDFPWIKQDGWIIPVNQPPSLANPSQYKSDGITFILETATTTEDIVIFKALLNDPDNDRVKLQVELKEQNQPFNGQDLLESDFVVSGSEIAITRTTLFERQYHWRARAIDINGAASDWQEFGTAGNVDFVVRLVPLYTQVFSKYPSETETWIWSQENYAYATPQKPYRSCGWTIGDCGCAITSEVMIMRFYGIATTASGDDVNPGTLNEWSSINNNGYYPNGNVKWPRIMDYSKDQFGIPRIFYTGPVNSKNTVILDGYLVNLEPAILSLKALNSRGEYIDHYIVADGKLSNTYTVKDPAWYNTRRLNQTADSYIQNYHNNFTGLRLFSPIAVLPDSISGHLASPAEMLFTDPLGRRLGKDSINNIEYNEIPGGVYYREGIGNPFPETPMPTEESKNIWIPDPADGKYDIQVIGTENGTYTLGTLIYDQAGQSKDVTQEGNTSLNNIQNFELDYSTTTVQQSEIYRIIDIDIKPGSYPNSINLKSKGVTPVAIITTPFFDAKNVVIDSVIFAGTKPLKGKLEDVDNDKDLDLILHFDTQSLRLTLTDTKAVLTGKLKDNTLIKGTDSIRIIQEPSKQTVLSKLFSFINQFIQNLVSAIGLITT